MDPVEEEGRRAFMDKLSTDACPYEGQAKVLWLKGYYKQEYDELKEEQASILESMGFYDHPFTGLEEHLRNVQSKIRELNKHGLPSSRSVS